MEQHVSNSDLLTSRCALWFPWWITDAWRFRLGLVLIAALSVAACGRIANADGDYIPNPKPPTDGLIGSNYTPAYAVNQVQFWHDFRPDVVDRELAAARKYFGNSHCRWHWVDTPGAPEPTVPWCGLMWPDATPVSLAEAEAIRSYVTGRTRAMFFDDLEQDNTAVR